MKKILTAIKNIGKSIEVNQRSNIMILAPMEGEVVELMVVNDGVFSSGMLGEGVAIIPSNGRVVSPINGRVLNVFDTKHAIGLATKEGVELLIHIGLDTVELKGKGFTTYVKEGDLISVGDLLMDFDKDEIINSGYQVITPIIVVNSGDYNGVKNIASNIVKEKDALLEIYTK